MTGRRVLYAGGLLAAGLFYLFDTGYFSFLLFVLALAFLPMELLISLPALLGARVSFAAVPRVVQPGQGFSLTLEPAARLPGLCLKARLCCENLFTGKESSYRLRFAVGGAARGLTVTYTLPPQEDCGVLCLCLKKVRVLDAAGIFAFPLRAPRPQFALAALPHMEGAPALPESALDQSTLPSQAGSRPGPGAMREFADIREYREGDSPRDVHWKLTAKWKKLMVREGIYSAYPAPQLCFNFYGQPAEVAKTLAVLAGLSHTLWQMERPHRIHWADAGGAPQSRKIASQADWDALEWDLLKTLLPGAGVPMAAHLPDTPGPVILVGPQSLRIYEAGVLKEVVE